MCDIWGEKEIANVRSAVSIMALGAGEMIQGNACWANIKT